MEFVLIVVACKLINPLSDYFLFVCSLNLCADKELEKVHGSGVDSTLAMVTKV